MILMAWSVVGVLVLAYALLAALVARRPLLRSIAFWQVRRNVRRSAVVVVSLAIGAAALSGLQDMTGSFQDRVADAAAGAAGGVDLQIRGSHPFDPALTALLSSRPEVGRLADGIQSGLELQGSVADLDRLAGKPDVELLGFDRSVQRSFGPYMLTDGRQAYGDRLGADEVLLSRPLADALEARPGDRLRVGASDGDAPSPAVDLRVSGIVEREGPGAYGPYRSVYLSLDTLQRAAGTTMINVIRISARGYGRAEMEAARRLSPHVTDLLAATPGATDLQVIERPAAAADFQLETSTQGTVLLTSLGLLIALAAGSLFVNVALALAEARRPQLGVLRALGLGRTDVVLIAIAEAAVYGLVVALAGTVVAIGVTWGLASFWQGIADALAGAPAGLSIAPLRVDPIALVAAPATAALIALATTLFTAVRTSRMTVSTLLQNAPATAGGRLRRRLRHAGLALLALVGLAGQFVDSPALRLAGGTCLIVFVVALARGRLPDRLRLSLGSAAAAAWAVVAMATCPEVAPPAEQVPVFLLALPIAVGGLSILVAVNLRLLEAVVGLAGRASGGLQATLRPPLTSMGRRPLRAALVTGSFAIVVALLTSFAGYLAADHPNYRHDSAGWDVRVWSVAGSIDLPPSVSSQIQRRIDVPTRGFTGQVRVEPRSGEQGTPGNWRREHIVLFGIPDQELREGMLPLTARDERFESDAAVWAALRDDPFLVISGVDAPGSVVALQVGTQQIRLRVAAQTTPGSPLLPGLVGSTRTLSPFAASPAGALMLLANAPGVDPAGLAREIQRSVFAQGDDATTARELLDAQFEPRKLFFSIVLGLLRLGLLVGVVALGLVALRATNERRQSVGVLRVLGYGPRQVMAGVMAEAMLGATLGVGVGLTAGYAVGIPAFREQTLGPFQPDPAVMAVALALIYAAVLLVSLGPALRASRLRPAEALRQTE